MITFKEFTKEPLKYADEIDIKKLESFLRKLSTLYYNKAESPVTDKIFDQLKEILEDKDPDNPFLNEIGAPITKNKVKLPYPMGSLNKIKPDSNELEKWLKTYNGPYELSDKLDGISALLQKFDNKISLYSRGDGLFGQDITHLLQYLKVETDNIPDNTAIRGELIMSKKNFKKIEEKMANARNAVAGVVNSKVVDAKMAKMVEFIAYNIINPRFIQSEQYKYLNQWKFKVVNHKDATKLNIEILVKYFEERRTESLYEIDGIVVMDNNMIYDVVEGNPKYGFAFKSIMKDQYAVAKVVDVEWDISRYGYIKPRIKIDPIKLVGVTVTYATAHNAKFIYDNKIGIGSKIKIIRSGDVIPKIMEVLTPSTDGKPKMPSIPFVWNETEVDIVVKTETKESNIITTTKQLVNTMKTLDVKYIDEGIMTKLVENGYINFIKILKAKHEDIYEIIGEKMTDKIYTGLEHGLKNTQLHILMSASNYFGRGLGTKKLHVVTKKYPDIMRKPWDDEKLFKKINKLDGFQEKTTQKFVEGFTEFKKFFTKINKYINIEYLRQSEEIKVETNIFQNQKIVVTGFRDSAVLEFIEKNGGDISGSVSKNTSLVICIDDTEDTSKLKKAKELKIPIITKTDFMKKYMNL